METFRVIHAVRIKDEEKQTFDYFQLKLETSKGRVLTLTDAKGQTKDGVVRLTSDYVDNILRQEELPVKELTARQKLRLVRSMNLRAEITLKTQGEEVIADEVTGVVNVGTADAPKWEKPKAGTKFKVAETGYWINYRKDVTVSLDDAVANQIEHELYQRASLQQADA